MDNWFTEFLARFKSEPPELLQSANKQSEEISRRLTLLEQEQERVKRSVQRHPVVDVIAAPKN